MLMAESQRFNLLAITVSMLRYSATGTDSLTKRRHVCLDSRIIAQHPDLDGTPFITYMLGIASLEDYQTNVGINVGINERVLELIRRTDAQLRLAWPSSLGCRSGKWNVQSSLGESLAC